MELKLEEGDGKSLKTLLQALNKNFELLNARFDNVDGSLKSLKDDILIKDVNAAKVAAEAALASATANTAVLNAMRKDVDQMKYNYETVHCENLKLRNQVNHLENYSRRDNLVIRGVAESAGENCDELARTFMVENLKMQKNFVNKIRFVRAHRLGKKPYGGQHYVRGLIVRFYNFAERQAVWSARKQLATTKFYLCENFCSETEFKRKQLYPIFRAANKNTNYDKKVFLYEDTLVVNNKVFIVNNLNDLPADLHPKNFSFKSNDTTLAFGGALSEFNTFSNWSPAKFEYNDHMYVSLEQAYMHTKALDNGDAESAKKIMYNTDPREIKFLGSKVDMTDIAKWDESREELMLNLLRAKFSQNPEMKAELLQTGERKLGETGRDGFYSVGLPLTHGKVRDPESWTADSKLGSALETIRQEFING